MKISYPPRPRESRACARGPWSSPDRRNSIRGDLPGAVMFAKTWRGRLTYAALSVFLAWHTMAMVIAPAPDVSAAVKAARVPFQPYLTLFRLDNLWDFFAPDVGRGAQFRYIIEDKSGNHHPFKPTEDLNWFHPTFFWFWSWFNAYFG